MRAVIAVLILAAAGAGYWWFAGPSASGLDAAGQTLVEKAERARLREEIDKDECRKLLQEIDRHPLHETNRALVRARTWLELLSGRSARAWDLISPNLGVDATSDDHLVASRVLLQRFSETGDEALAHLGATHAERHFEASGEKGSLFLAWQLQIRREDDSRSDEVEKALVEKFPGSHEARLATALVLYPRLQEEAPGARDTLRKLEQEFAVIPEELDLALALFEIDDDSTLPSCEERVRRVLRSCPSHVLARTLSGVVAMKKKDYATGKKIFESLLRVQGHNPRARFWTNMIEVADQQLGGK